MNDEAIKQEKKTVNFFKKKDFWISCIIGIIIGAGLMFLLGLVGFPGLGHKTIVKYKGGKLTQDDIYKEMYKYDISSYVFQIAEEKILKEEYKLTDKQNKEIEDDANQIISSYTNYGYKENEFLESNGFNTKEDFIEYLGLDYRRNLCKIDYLKKYVSDDDINNYYNNNEIFGKINTKHILVMPSDEITDKEALEITNEIISKLKAGEKFDDLALEYQDKAQMEEVSFDGITSKDYDKNYVNAALELEVDSYTQTPVKTEYGYHVIYCTSKADKAELEDVRDEIIDILARESGIDTDMVQYVATIELGKKYKIEFKDKKLQDKYNDYCKQIEMYLNNDADDLNDLVEADDADNLNNLVDVDDADELDNVDDIDLTVE